MGSLHTATAAETRSTSRAFAILRAPAAGPRPAARLPRQRRVFAEAGAGARRDGAGLPNNLRPFTAARTRTAARSTDLYEQARATIARFIGAPSDSQIVFTRNATEALNLVAFSYARAFLGPATRSC
jgi:hypothetical protein